MSAWPPHPVIHEVNTAAWLTDVGQRAGTPVTLADVPAAEWDAVTPTGVDAVWLMGVWERSESGRRLALASHEQRASFAAALPDVVDEDVLGSAYCIRRYEVDPRFGGRDGLAAARAALAARGVRLLVDFVPNHVAPDHPWLTTHPEHLVRGTVEDLERDPDAFLRVGDTIAARGRDPNFPPWPDVVQLDAFAPGLRRAAAGTLVDIARQADGVRCDMAMLVLNEVFVRTWGDRVGPPPGGEYWTGVVAAVRRRSPDFLLVAEAYWDLEARLHELGFDHCYDKRLYDRLVHADPAGVRAHLGADPGYQRRLVRFVENHDEPRAAAALPGARSRAAAVAVATLPGATLWHEGQFEGRQVGCRCSSAAGRPRRPTSELRRFHLALVAAAARIRRGSWAPCPTRGWPDDDSHDQLLAWSWTDGRRRTLVVVDLADAPAAARVALPWDDLAGRSWVADDVLSGERYERDGTELAREGLYVELPPWGLHVLQWTAAAAAPPVAG